MADHDDQLAKVKDQPRSWSQLGQMGECGHRFYLERIAKVWSQPAAWFPMGTAVHEAAEKWEKAGRPRDFESRTQVDDWFMEAYDREVNEALAETPNPRAWAASGPRYPGNLDIPRRFDVGREHTQRYIDYYEAHPGEVIWIDPEGNPAAELFFNVDLDGVRVRGYIDALIQLEDGSLVPRDTKTGASPSDPRQVKVYGVAVEETYGIEVTRGDLLMTKDGKVKSYDLAKTSRQEIVDQFGQLDADVKAEKFDPKPGAQCFRCGVRDSCEYKEDGR